MKSITNMYHYYSESTEQQQKQQQNQQRRRHHHHHHDTMRTRRDYNDSNNKMFSLLFLRAAAVGVLCLFCCWFCIIQNSSIMMVCNAWQQQQQHRHYRQQQPKQLIKASVLSTSSLWQLSSTRRVSLSSITSSTSIFSSPPARYHDDDDDLSARTTTTRSSSIMEDDSPNHHDHNDNHYYSSYDDYDYDADSFNNLVGSNSSSSTSTTSPISSSSTSTSISTSSNLVGGTSSTTAAGNAIKRNDNEWRFFDVARIHVNAGNGGKGCVSFRREKGEPLGGPSGGRGGNGGSIYLKCDTTLNTLKHFKRGGRIHIKAKSGKSGQGKNRNGSSGNDIYIPVPPGTIIRDYKTMKYAGELRYEGDIMLVARGGRGGRGNAAFVTSTRTSPKFSELGEYGGNRWLYIELKLIADVGLLAIPNAGKSTLLKACTSAKPKIANYPFTTIVPNLGVCYIDDMKMMKQRSSLSPSSSSTSGSSTSSSTTNLSDQSLVLCDIPGLIRGAHDGIGMGDAFLRHVQRCTVLLHIIDGSSSSPIDDYLAINEELKLYDHTLYNKPQIVIINKMDIPSVRQQWIGDNSDNESSTNLMKQLRIVCGHTRIMTISAVTTENVHELMERVYKFVHAQKQQQKKKDGDDKNNDQEDDTTTTTTSLTSIPSDPEIDLSMNGLDYDSDEFVIHTDPAYPGQYRVSGRYIEEIAKMTHWEYPEAVERFGRQLDAIGISAELEQHGAIDGDLVMIDEYDFEYRSSGNAGGGGGESSNNPYLPDELLLEGKKENEDSRNTMKKKKKKVGAAATTASTRKRGRGVANDEKTIPPWRPFPQGGFLDVDTDEILGFTDSGHDWSLLEQQDQQMDLDNDDDDEYVQLSNSNKKRSNSNRYIDDEDEDDYHYDDYDDDDDDDDEYNSDYYLPEAGDEVWTSQ